MKIDVNQIKTISKSYKYLSEIFNTYKKSTAKQSAVFNNAWITSSELICLNIRIPYVDS